MSNWNYRIVCETVEGLGIVEDVWTIRSVSYNDDKTIEGWSAEPVAPEGGSQKSLTDDLLKMSAAASLPPLYVVGERLETSPDN